MSPAAAGSRAESYQQGSEVLFVTCRPFFGRSGPGVGAAGGHWRGTHHHRGTREGLPSNARVRYSATTPRRLGRQPNDIVASGRPRRRPLPIAVALLPRQPIHALPGTPVLSPSVLRWTENHSLGAVAVPSGCSMGAVAVHEIGSRSTSAPVRPLLPQFIGAVAVRLYNHSLCTVTKGGREAVRNGGDNAAKAGAEGFQTSKRGRK